LNWKLETGNWKLETGSWELATESEPRDRDLLARLERRLVRTDADPARRAPRSAFDVKLQLIAELLLDAIPAE
jgi:hypothetical protein